MNFRVAPVLIGSGGDDHMFGKLFVILHAYSNCCYSVLNSYLPIFKIIRGRSKNSASVTLQIRYGTRKYTI